MNAPEATQSVSFSWSITAMDGYLERWVFQFLDFLPPLFDIIGVTLSSYLEYKIDSDAQNNIICYIGLAIQHRRGR